MYKGSPIFITIVIQLLFIIFSYYINNQQKEPQPCFYFCKIIKISEEHTNTIDKIIINNSKKFLIRGVEFMEKDIVKPIDHSHYYCTDSVLYRYFSCINIIKYQIDKKNKISKYYINYYYSSVQNQLVHDFLSLIFKKQENQINTISIDTSSMLMDTMIIQKKFNPIPQQNQVNALYSIYNHYEVNLNTKVIVYGQRGTGKTYLGKLIKNHIDKTLFVKSRLYDDFNPSSIGVNIKKIALRYANIGSPIILVINEIDKIYMDVIKNKTKTYDTRGYHTKDISSFHNMMDDIADTNNVITIFTTEKSKKQLQENKNYLSFFRKGRIDFFINMTYNDSTIELL